MVDIRRLRVPIAEKFFKALHSYRKPDLTKAFIKRWIELLHEYSKIPTFRSFHSKIPHLENLSPEAESLLIVPFEDSKTPRLAKVSVIPLYPFRVYLEHKSVCCKEGLEFIQMYLTITSITLVGFYDIKNYKKIIETLKASHPNVQYYAPSLFKFFCARNKARHGRKFYEDSTTNKNVSTGSRHY